jgi:hypothetical protein
VSSPLTTPRASCPHQGPRGELRGAGGAFGPPETQRLLFPRLASRPDRRPRRLSPATVLLAADETTYDFWREDRRVSLYVFGDEFTGDSIDRVLKTVDHLNRPDRAGERKVRIHAIGFPTIFSQARYGETTGIRFATLMRLLCEQNGGAFVALNSLTP